jgi:hypothetical protein
LLGKRLLEDAKRRERWSRSGRARMTRHRASAAYRHSQQSFPAKPHRPHTGRTWCSGEPNSTQLGQLQARQQGLLKGISARSRGPRVTAMGVRRDKAALSRGCKSHPAICYSRKQSDAVGGWLNWRLRSGKRLTDQSQSDECLYRQPRRSGGTVRFPHLVRRGSLATSTQDA